MPEKKEETKRKNGSRIEIGHQRNGITIDVVIGHEPFDFGLRHDAKMSVSIRQRHTKAKRRALQPAVVIALPTNADSFLSS